MIPPCPGEGGEGGDKEGQKEQKGGVGKDGEGREWEREGKNMIVSSCYLNLFYH